MVGVAVGTAAGWLLLFLGLLAVPPAARPDGGGPEYGGAPEPPAVVSLLAGRLRRDGFGATLLDLAARGWFRLTRQASPAGPSGRGPLRLIRGGASAGPVMCVIPAEVPAEPLTPYERRVVAHVAARVGARGTVPAAVLADGFENGQTEFMRGFGHEVTADTRQRGLTESRLSPSRIALLCALLLLPAGALLLALHDAHRAAAMAEASWAYVALAVLTIVVGTRRRCSAAGRAVLRRWRAAVATGSGGDGRLLAYAAALGAAPAAVAVFASPGKNVAWSDYRGGWRQIAIETNNWPWRSALCLLAASIGGPFLFLGAALWLGMHGLPTVGGDLGGLAGLVGFAGLVVWTLRARLFPWFTEFDGQVIRQWVVAGGEDSPDDYHLAIDDGARAKAWDLEIPDSLYREATPGAIVHARVSRWSERKATVWLVRPAAVAPQLAHPGVPFDPRGHGDPAGTAGRLAGGPGTGAQAGDHGPFGIIDFNQY